MTAVVVTLGTMKLSGTGVILGRVGVNEIERGLQNNYQETKGCQLRKVNNLPARTEKGVLDHVLNASFEPCTATSRSPLVASGTSL